MKILVTKDEAAKILRLIKQGHTIYEVAKIMNRHSKTIQRWYKQRQSETFFNVDERENWAI